MSHTCSSQLLQLAPGVIGGNIDQMWIQMYKIVWKAASESSIKDSRIFHFPYRILSIQSSIYAHGLTGLHSNGRYFEFTRNMSSILDVKVQKPISTDNLDKNKIYNSTRNRTQSVDARQN